jgi:hypothetical protein
MLSFVVTCLAVRTCYKAVRKCYKVSIQHLHYDILCAPVECLLQAKVHFTVRQPHAPVRDVCQLGNHNVQRRRQYRLRGRTSCEIELAPTSRSSLLGIGRDLEVVSVWLGECLALVMIGGCLALLRGPSKLGPLSPSLPLAEA